MVFIMHYRPNYGSWTHSDMCYESWSGAGSTSFSTSWSVSGAGARRESRVPRRNKLKESAYYSNSGSGCCC